MKAATLTLWAIALYWAMPYIFFFIATFFFFTLLSIGAI